MAGNCFSQISLAKYSRNRQNALEIDPRKDIALFDPITPEPITFREFPKMARLHRGVTITEKLDGTNACVIITEDGRIGAQSRQRIITPLDDNYGFAAWVERNKDELMKLGAGYHFGEWWGQGIQRNYGMKEKVFSLFNVGRWASAVRPACCSVVPVLWQGDVENEPQSVVSLSGAVWKALYWLREGGSAAAPGFKNPEGIVIWHEAARQYFKVTLKDDDKPKGMQ